jgi:peptidoglycan L-alanyl-D-glutamate endopeptidase CwlK
MDSRTTTLLGNLHPVIAQRFITLAIKFQADTGDSLELVQGLRSWQSQVALWAQGRTSRSTVGCEHDRTRRPIGTCAEHPLGATVTDAEPGYSWHEFGLAIDICPHSLLSCAGWDPESSLWRKIRELAEGMGFTCGALWTHPDIPHLQITGRFPVTPDDEVRQLFRDGGMAAVWQESGIQ